SRTFANYTSYFGPDSSEHFFDCPNVHEFRDEAKRQLEARLRDYGSDSEMGGIRGRRRHMRRVNLRHDEFIAVLSIMFWNTEGLEVSEDVTCASQSYKEMILKELHSYYHDELRLVDYAAR
ncbi:hypothetical protein PENTCL1PPCAC_12854, partial [Pristionchus entomophagus]